MKTKTSHRFTIPIISTLSSIMMTAAFSQATPPSSSAPVSNPATQSLPADAPSLPTNVPVTPPGSATGVIASPAAPSASSHFSDLTPADKMKLRAAHDQAMKDPAVMEARKTARVTLYNAMINADPTIEPLLSKAGIKPPSNVESSIKNSNIGSEEKILAGNASKWDKQVLAPTVKQQEQTPSAAETNHSPTNPETSAPAASPMP